jgi:hypothetical protein
MYPTPPERADEQQHFRELARLDAAYGSAKRVHEVLLVLAAVLGILPWIGIGVPVWGTILLMALVTRVQVWLLRRDLERCVTRLADRATKRS